MRGQPTTLLANCSQPLRDLDVFVASQPRWMEMVPRTSYGLSFWLLACRQVLQEDLQQVRHEAMWNIWPVFRSGGSMLMAPNFARSISLRDLGLEELHWSWCTRWKQKVIHTSLAKVGANWLNHLAASLQTGDQLKSIKTSFGVSHGGTMSTLWMSSLDLGTWCSLPVLGVRNWP
jgi:hypothetical protein